ncbi:MAG: hypothetical protein PVH84_03660 [Candidatus Aminicenantes bacterium]|jgi:hypothetical protein
MKRSAVLLFISFLVPVMISSAEDLLKVNVSINPMRLRRGQEGKVVLKVTVNEEVRISSQPSFTIDLEPSDELIFPKNFFSASDLEIEIKEEDGKEYLDLKGPIEIPFSVNMDAKRGNHTLKGKIKYFACSQEEGWCLKYTAKFSSSFYTSSRIYQKKK